MNIFDYLFYRFYHAYRKRHDSGHGDARLEALLSLSMIYEGLTGPILLKSIGHFFPLGNYRTVCILIMSAIYTIYVYFRFCNRIDLLNGKYKDCRLNKYIPDYLLWLFIFLALGIGVGIAILASKYLGLKLAS